MRKKRNGLERLVLGVIGVVCVLAPWEILVRLKVLNIYLVSSPSQVFDTLRDQVAHDELWHNLWVTFQEWGLGFAVAAGVGVALGIAAGLVRAIRVVADPWLNVLNAVPELALVPIFIVWFGIGLEFKVWLGFTGGVFVIAINTMAGVHGTDQRYLAVAQTYGASRARVIRTVIIPGAVPYIITGLRQGSARALVGVIVGEFLASNQGLGFYINNAGQVLEINEVMVGIFILCIYGVLLSEILRLIERRFAVWRQE